MFSYQTFLVADFDISVSLLEALFFNKHYRFLVLYFCLSFVI